LLEIPSRFFEHNAMAFLLLFFTVALSLCVVGLVVLALASILGSVRDYGSEADSYLCRMSALPPKADIQPRT
jgi:purine-cytosine permease-like protein